MTYVLDLFDNIDLDAVLQTPDTKYVAFALSAKARAFSYVRDSVTVHTEADSSMAYGCDAKGDVCSVILKNDDGSYASHKDFSVDTVDFVYGIFHVNCQIVGCEDSVGEQHYLVVRGDIVLNDTVTTNAKWLQDITDVQNLIPRTITVGRAIDVLLEDAYVSAAQQKKQDALVYVELQNAIS